VSDGLNFLTALMLTIKFLLKETFPTLLKPLANTDPFQDSLEEFFALRSYSSKRKVMKYI